MSKTRITIRLDDEIVKTLKDKAKEFGVGYQSLINGILKLATLDDTTKAHQLMGIEKNIDFLKKIVSEVENVDVKIYENNSNLIADATKRLRSK